MKKDFYCYGPANPYNKLKKLLQTAKIVIFLLFCGVLNVLAIPTIHQFTKISLNLRNATIEQVLDKIEEQSEYNFQYDQKLIDATRKVDIVAESKSVNEILDNIFDGNDVKYSILDRQIILSDKSDVSLINGLQQREITGRVTDSQTGEALPGVNIIVKGTTIGALTDVDGKYSILAPSQDAILVFSFIGFDTKEMPVAGKSIIDISLAANLQNLEEVVVVGYGTQRKVTLTGSVASVNNQEIVKTPTNNISNAITGLLPGVVTLNRSGEPGRDDATVLIRGMSTTGNTSPLVVVDGIQGYSGWQRINSNDIESISILKDASAAIYGARAANGVILITTKRGTIGKPTFNYSFNQGISQPTRVPVMASSALFAEFVNDRLVMNGALPKYTSEEIQKFKDGSDPINYPNTDWYGEVLKKYSLQSQHNLSINGGTENVTYFVSGSYSDQGGIFKNGSTNFKTYSLLGRVDAHLNKSIKVGFDMNGSMDDGNYPAFSTATTFAYLRDESPD